MRPLLLCLALIVSVLLHAQFPYNESCKNGTASGFIISGSAKLTAAAGIDAPGAGYLRLTDNTLNNVGYAYAQASFPSNYGLTTSFEFFSWKPGASSTNQADGMTFFLFDASVNAFRPGGIGGALGYAQYYSTPGMAKGYIGISIDEFGNFSNPADGAKNGGPGQQRGSVAIRGPGNGKASGDYVYQTGVIASDPAYNAGFQLFAQRFPDPTNTSYRKLKVMLSPGSSAGSNIGYKVTVIMYKGGASLTPVTLINNFDYPFPAPAKLQFGLAASTGSISNYHEIRNINVDVANGNALVAPGIANDAVTLVCQGQPTLIDVTANDVSNNVGGAINKATVDLDPAVAGIQSAYSVAGKGSFSVDVTGVVTFIPAAGFSGTTTAAYTVTDTYGMTTPTGALITVNVTNSAAPVLVLSDPAPVCAPAAVDITSPAWKITTAPGASFTYFATLTDAHEGTNNINAGATAIRQSGIYYIKETLGGCATVKPLAVQIGVAPTPANAGADQLYCSSNGGQTTTLLATNPDVGTGAWTQVSGPSAALINYPEASTTLVANMAKGVYTFRWTTSTSGCPVSADDVQVSVGVTAVAGTAQALCNASAATLAANAAAPGVGVWTQISGPTISFANAADPTTTVTGLVPGNNYGLQWRINNGGCSTTSTVSINNAVNTIANAGPDQLVGLISQFSLTGNTPAAGNSGTWSVVTQPVLSAVQIASVNSPVSSVTSVALLGDYTFRWTLANGSCINSDDVTVRVSTLLPARLLSFTAKLASEQTALVEWETAGEQNVDRYEIERSGDGQSFTKIGTLSRTNSGSNSNQYTLRDDIALIMAPLLFYRLMQIDKDGAATYSPVVSLTRSAKRQAGVLANPFISQLIIRLQTPTEDVCTIKLADSKGVVVKSVVKRLAKGIQVVTLDDLAGLSMGNYIVLVYFKNEMQTIKVAKQ